MARVPVRNRYRRTALAAALLAGLTSGCGSAGTPLTSPQSSGQAPHLVAPADPLKLVGMWRIEAPGEEAGAVLRLGDDLMIWRKCGPDLGGWAANNAGLFIGAVEGSTGPCPFTLETTKGPEWLVATTSFAIEGTSRRLLDSTGGTTAVLRPGAEVTGSEHIVGFLAQPPDLTEELTASINASSSIAVGTPARGAPAELLGRWIPLEQNGKPTLSDSFVTFSRGGWWLGSDGCNGQSGRWVQGKINTFLALQGPQTLIGCKGIAVGSVLSHSTTAAMNGTTLVMSDRAGKEIGQFVRP